MEEEEERPLQQSTLLVERGTQNDNDGTGWKMERGRADDYNNNDDYGDDNDDNDNKEVDDNNKRWTITTTAMTTTTTTKIKGQCSCRAKNGRGRRRRRRIVIALALLLPRKDVCRPTSERTMPQPPLCPRRRRCRCQPRPMRAGRAPIENIAPKNDTRWRGVAPLPPPPSALHSSFVKGTRQGRSPRLPSCSRRRMTSACPCCCATRWSRGIRNYGSLKEGEGDKEFDGVTKNSWG